MDNRHGRILMVLFVVALGIMTGALVLCRPGRVMAQAQPGSEQPGAPRMGIYRPRPMPSTGRMIPSTSSSTPSAIAAADGYVYVLQGNTLYQYSSKTLKPVNKTEVGTVSTSGEQRYLMPESGISTAP